MRSIPQTNLNSWVKIEADAQGAFAILDSLDEKATNLSTNLEKVDVTADAVDTKTQKVEKKIEKAKMSAAQAWTYGNQVASMILNISQQALKGTKHSAGAQVLLSALQLGQQEFAVYQTQMQAIEAFAAGNYVQYALLQSLVAMMQGGILVAQANMGRAKSAEQEIAEMANSMDSYRS